MKIAIVGATGLVGSVLLSIMEERNFPVSELILAASKKSVGKKILFKGNELSVVDVHGFFIFDIFSFMVKVGLVDTITDTIL